MEFLRQRIFGGITASSSATTAAAAAATTPAAPGTDGRGKGWLKDTSSEAALIASARQGDRAAFDALVRRHESLLRGFLLRRIDAEAVDDLLQEVWLACWSALSRFQRRSCFKTWLYSIALNKCMDYHRAQRRAPATQSLDGQDGAAAAAAYSGPYGEADLRSPEELYAAAEMRESIRRMMDNLPPSQREVLDLYYYAELTLPEIAAALDRNLNTVKYQFYRGHDRIAQQMDDASAALGSGVDMPARPAPASASAAAAATACIPASRMLRHGKEAGNRR